MKAFAGAPNPPADLNARILPLDVLVKGTLIHRIHHNGYSAEHFDTSTKGRFNAPDASFGALYCAQEKDGAFAETLLREAGATSISEEFVATRAHTVFQLTQDVKLVRMYGSSLHVIGATATVTSIESYTIPQIWAKALFDHPEKPDGLVYRSRHDDDQKCVVLFQKETSPVGVVTTSVDLLSEPWLYMLMEKYGVGLAPD